MHGNVGHGMMHDIMQVRLLASWLLLLHLDWHLGVVRNIENFRPLAIMGEFGDRISLKS